LKLNWQKLDQPDLKTMKLSLAISPCPNDTFIFEALLHQRLGNGQIEYDLRFEDIQTLNQIAVQGLPDVCKVSVGVLPLISENYQVLDSGAALGPGCGPLLIAKREFPAEPAVIENLEIAIPGENTTAHLLLSHAFPGIRKKHFMVFSEIESALISGKVEAGVIIHENRFTYASKGLKKIVDLGAYWEDTFHTPVPLGCIVIRRSIPDSIKKMVELQIRQSVEYALRQPVVSHAFVSRHAQEMDPVVMQQHIDLYVNEYSVSLGEQGKHAINQLLHTAKGSGQPVAETKPLFV
jgi:1,4-dihydroxy-6-naphthoate synthase